MFFLWHQMFPSGKRVETFCTFFPRTCFKGRIYCHQFVTWLNRLSLVTSICTLRKKYLMKIPSVWTWYTIFVNSPFASPYLFNHKFTFLEIILCNKFWMRQLLVQKYPTVQSGLDFFALILPSACPCNQLFSRFSFSGMLYTLIRIETDVLSKVQTKEVPSPNHFTIIGKC